MRLAVVLWLMSAASAWAQLTTTVPCGVGVRGDRYLVMFAEVQVSPMTGEGAGRVYGQLYDVDGGTVGARVELEPSPGDQGCSDVVCGSDVCFLGTGEWTSNNFTPQLRVLRADAGLGQSSRFDAGVPLETCRAFAVDGGFLFLCAQGTNFQLHTLSSDGVWQRAAAVTTPNRYVDGMWRFVPGTAGTHLLAYASDWQPGGMTSSRFLVLDGNGATISARQFSPPLAAPSWHLSAVPDGWLGWFLATQPNQPLQPFAFRADGGFTTLAESPGPGAREVSGGDALFDGREVLLSRRQCVNPMDCLESFQASIARADVNGRFVDAQWVPLTPLAPTSEPALATMGDGNSFAVFSVREADSATSVFLRKLRTAVVRRGAVGRGGACVTGSDCAAGFCASGACCDSQCLGACQTCLASEGASTDGLCAPRRSASVCRLAQPCFIDATCDGITPTCPANGAVVDGGVCDDADPLTSNDVCRAGGVCRGSAPPGPDAGSQGGDDAGSGTFVPPDAGTLPPPDMKGSCGGCGATSSMGWLGLAGLLFAGRLRRRRD